MSYDQIVRAAIDLGLTVGFYGERKDTVIAFTKKEDAVAFWELLELDKSELDTKLKQFWGAPHIILN